MALMTPRRCRTAGFTLIELMATLAIAAILAAIAVPSFRGFLVNQQVRGTSSELVSALTFARSEAIKRAADVSVTRASSWTAGWSVVSGGVTLREYPAAHGLELTASSMAASITFDRDGRVSSPPRISIEPEGLDTPARCVRIGTSGKATAARGACSS